MIYKQNTDFLTPNVHCKDHCVAQHWSLFLAQSVSQNGSLSATDTMDTFFIVLGSIYTIPLQEPIYMCDLCLKFIEEASKAHE